MLCQDKTTAEVPNRHKVLTQELIEHLIELVRTFPESIEVRVAVSVIGDFALPSLITAGVFVREQVEIPHVLSGVTEAGDVSLEFVNRYPYCMPRQWKEMLRRSALAFYREEEITRPLDAGTASGCEAVNKQIQKSEVDYLSAPYSYQ